MAPARIGGSTFSTSARTSSCSSNFTLRVRASTATALCCGRYSTMPAYCSAHTFLKSAGFDCTSGFASRISTFARGLAALNQLATWQARSYGPGGQRYGDSGIAIANTPPSGMASSWRRNASVSAPAFQACRRVPSSFAALRPATPSHISSTPGDSTSLS